MANIEITLKDGRYFAFSLIDKYDISPNFLNIYFHDQDTGVKREAHYALDEISIYTVKLLIEEVSNVRKG